MKEIWKDIPNYQYQISDLGHVISKNSGQPLKILTNYNGYSVINLYNSKGMRQFRISRLVAINFIPNPKKKKQVNHKNGIKADNRAVNLEWTSARENINHAWGTGLTKTFGNGNGRAILSEKEAIKILKDQKINRRTHSVIAKEFGISESAINYLLARKTWKHITINS